MDRKKMEAIARIAGYVRNILFPKNQYNDNDLKKRVKSIFNIDILYTNYTEVDGYVRWNSSTKLPQIVISRRDNSTRQLFTVAHELGHLFLHWKWYPGRVIKLDSNNNVLSADKYGETMYRGKVSSPYENDANEFAGNLLMPRNKVNNIYGELSSSTQRDLNKVKYYISSIFGVSEDAAFTRLRILKEEGQLVG